MASQRDAALESRIHDLAAPIAAEIGVEVLEVEVVGSRGSRVVRITADAVALEAAAGLDIDDVALLSRRLSAAMDDQDPVDGGYTLEVTSPGADRPLVRSRDFARNLGRDVRVRRHVDDEVETVSGELTAATNEAITLRDGRDEVVLSLAEIEHAHVVLPW